MNQNMVNAIVAIEDSRYWVHGALDLRGTIRAAVNDIQHQPVQGGSTIAQQYVKNILLQAEESGNVPAEKAAYADTLNRKLNELRLAVGVEHQPHQAADPGRVPERRVLRRQRYGRCCRRNLFHLSMIFKNRDVLLGELLNRRISRKIAFALKVGNVLSVILHHI